jgi:hypothetical protein
MYNGVASSGQDPEVQTLSCSATFFRLLLIHISYHQHQGLEIVRANDSLPHWEYVAGLYKASWSISPQSGSLN